MTYQVRVTNPDGSDPIVLNLADNIDYHKVVNTPNEGISFDYPTADYKSAYITNSKYWEFWDVKQNKRLNRGPIHGIDDSDSGVLKVSGPGRSQLLLDHIQTDLVTFHASVPVLLDNLRYENVAASPSTKTYVWDGKSATKEIFFPTSISIDTDQYMQYYGLSKQTKDNAIDDNTGYILPGAERPSNTYYVTDSYWAGTDKVDSLVIDLGDTFLITKSIIQFPWWGGIQRLNNRGYSFKFSYSTFTGEFADIDPADWVTLYEDTEGRHVGGWTFFFSTDPGLNSIEWSAGTPIFLGIDPLNIRYFRILITGTKAWFGTVYDAANPVDRWGHQCDPDSTDDISAPTTSAAYPKMRGKKISDRVLEPQNDCYAGVVEFGAFVTLLERNDITGLVKQRIKSDNKQITYFHSADASETITTGNYRKYEPGMFFKRAEVSYSGASTAYTKFYDKDCTNCYESFNFGVVDDLNSLIYSSDNASESNSVIRAPRNAKSITMKGSSNAVINNVDAWLSKLDPLSWGGGYAYSETIGDTAVLNFRGASFMWWATVPAAKTGATVSIEYRTKSDITGNWSGWTTLEAGFILPSDITSEVIYDVPYNELFVPDTTYEIRITNLDGNYASIDSFGGWWRGSMVDLNDDSERLKLQFPNDWKQIYDSRFSEGTMMKTNKTLNYMSLGFEGDRVQVYSAKGRYHGKITLQMSFQDTTTPGPYDATDTHRVFIPGGDLSDGSLTIDLNTGKKGHEVPGILIFDSNTLSGWKFGSGGTPMDSLPWGIYSITINAPHTGTYMADLTVEDSDQFTPRCSDCNPPTSGDTEINRFIFVDGISVHERVGLSSSWKLEKNLDIISSIGEALELEWDIGEEGLTIAPRIGDDTDIILKEGVNTVISSQVVKDGSKMATQLISSGADIDGLPLFSVVESRINRQVLGRTVQQIQDYRSVADYFTLIGVSRAELVRRREPEHRIQVSHIGYQYGLEAGDSFIAKKKTLSALRVRINSLTINQSFNSGIQYNLECIKWPPIV